MMNSITDVDYKHAKSVWEAFGSKYLGQYYNLYVQSDVLLLVDIFKSVRNKCLEIYKVNPAYFLSVFGLERQPCLKAI